MTRQVADRVPTGPMSLYDAKHLSILITRRLTLPSSDRDASTLTEEEKLKLVSDYAASLWPPGSQNNLAVKFQLEQQVRADSTSKPADNMGTFDIGLNGGLSSSRWISSPKRECFPSFMSVQILNTFEVLLLLLLLLPLQSHLVAILPRLIFMTVPRIQRPVSISF